MTPSVVFLAVLEPAETKRSQPEVGLLCFAPYCKLHPPYHKLRSPYIALSLLSQEVGGMV